MRVSRYILDNRSTLLIYLTSVRERRKREKKRDEIYIPAKVRKARVSESFASLLENSYYHFDSKNLSFFRFFNTISNYVSNYFNTHFVIVREYIFCYNMYRFEYAEISFERQIARQNGVCRLRGKEDVRV